MRKDLFYLKDGTSLVIPHPESYKDCMLLIKSDSYRITGRIESYKTIVFKNLWHIGDSSLFWFRLCQYRGALFHFFCYIYIKISRKANIYIPPMTRIGYGLDIGHGMSIVINGGTIIGNNVNLSHFLSIGTNCNTPAIIGDNVYIGPNTSVVEDVCICNDVTVGAGSVVVKDVEAKSTVVGCPAKIVNFKNPARYIVNKFPLP